MTDYTDEDRARYEEFKRANSMTPEEGARRQKELKRLDEEARERLGMPAFDPAQVTAENYNLAKWMDHDWGSPSAKPSSRDDDAEDQI